eukprot:2831399-Pyramimonas_sp.AAC.1
MPIELVLRLRRLRSLPGLLKSAPACTLAILDELASVPESRSALCCDDLLWPSRQVNLAREFQPSGPPARWLWLPRSSSKKFWRRICKRAESAARAKF